MPSPAQLFAAQPVLTFYLVGFAVAVALSLALTYGVRQRARSARLFDFVDERKVHDREIPRIGGVAIFLTVVLTLATVVALFGSQVIELGGDRLIVLLAGGSAIHLLGLWDDVRPMRARWKFLAQIIVTLAIYIAGVRIQLLSLPFAGSVELGPVLGLVFTVFWFVGITNAFNLIDGLDGLASGAALFALTTMFVVASIYGQTGAALLSLVLAGATLGFLVYNFHPASIFLGDSGSLFLGFMLAGIGALSSQKSPTAIAVAIPVVSLGLPVLDTGLAIVRRFLRGKPIFGADRGHIHHRLLGLGHSPRKVALLLYGACALLALMGMLLVNDTGYIALVLVIAGLGIGIAVQRLRFYEFEEFARLLRRGAQSRDVIAHRVRVREASLRLQETQSLEKVFQTLDQTFSEDLFHRVEVRLRRSFIEGVLGHIDLDRRLEDDIAIWNWSRAGGAEPGWWEIRLPLMRDEHERFGSLVLWQDGKAGDTSLSHLHMIAGQLRSEVEQKLLTLWHPGFDLEALDGGDVAAAVSTRPMVRDPVVTVDAVGRGRAREVRAGHSAA